MTSDPIARYRDALKAAQQAGEQLADAATLATATTNGVPSARMVLIKSADERGFSFYTNLNSRKARELADNPVAAMCVHWKSVVQQVRIEGSVVPLGDAEADAYWATRARGSQVGAWASRQSEPLGDRDALLAQVAGVEQRFGSGQIPRPPFWSGFLLTPIAIEFWEGHDDRLHVRELYRRTAGGWTVELLQP